MMHVTNSRGATVDVPYVSFSMFRQLLGSYLFVSIYFLFPFFPFPFPLSPYMPTLSLFVSFEYTIYLCSSLWLPRQPGWEKKALWRIGVVSGFVQIEPAWG
jgi:hypothetical protein